MVAGGEPIQLVCTSKINNMSYLFQEKISFNEDISSWDTSSVRDMRRMFYYALDFNKNIELWDTFNVKEDDHTVGQTYFHLFRKYIDSMVKEWKATTNHLFDKKENLYYRDVSYFDKLDNGTKIFWGRGNGWVFAGLSNVMDELGPSDKDYPYFLKLY